MEITPPEPEAVALAESPVAGIRPARCSIILPLSAEPSELAGYMRRLEQRNTPCDYEVITDAQGTTVRGKYLLFVRELVDFDLAMLDESIRELETSGNELSVSQTGKFILVERSLYQRVGDLDALVNQTRSTSGPGEPALRQSVHRVVNLSNEPVDFTCGPDTSIDPDVVIDTPERVRIGAHCVIRKGVVLRPEGGEIVIGDHCVINHYSVFHGKGGVYIGDWTVIAPHCGFYAQNHTFDRFDVPITKQPNVGRGIYVMGDNWVGAGAVVCDDVTLGKGAVIGANATVTKSVPMAAVAVGSPARVIHKRYGPDWDFQQRERAACAGMPQEIQNYVEQRGRRLAELLGPQDTVLDIGCGEGIITSLLAQTGARVTGCDYSLEAVETAARQFPNIRFVYSNSTCLRFENGSFTTAVLSEVAEHLLREQLEKTLREASRVLQPRGLLLLATPLTGKGTCTSTYAHIYEYAQDEMQVLLDQVFDEVRLLDNRFGLFVARKR